MNVGIGVGALVQVGVGAGAGVIPAQPDRASPTNAKKPTRNSPFLLSNVTPPNLSVNDPSLRFSIAISSTRP